jgi:hypothetical protein
MQCRVSLSVKNFNFAYLKKSWCKYFDSPNRHTYKE